MGTEGSTFNKLPAWKCFIGVLTSTHRLGPDSQLLYVVLNVWVDGKNNLHALSEFSLVTLVWKGSCFRDWPDR